MLEQTRRAWIVCWIVGGCLLGVSLVVGGIFWSLRQQPVADNSKQPGADDSRAVARLERPAAADQSYVGSEVCAKCHAEISRIYQRHPMSHSLAPVSTVKPVEDYVKRKSFKAGPCEYRIERKEGRVWHHESLTDTDNEVLYDQSVEVQYALGSGVRGRSYLVDRDGLMFQSPIGWYTGKAWDLSPGYAPGRNQGFNRRITDGCLQCHAGRVNASPSRPDYFPAPAFHEAAIGCERCHGPGQKHVEYRQLALDGKVSEQMGTDPITNPVKLPPAEREAVCYQCHLQAVDRIARYGRSQHDFRPGNKINDIWTVFLNGTGIESAGSTEVVTQVEQMHSSQCFQKSDGRMGCISCHDPHDVPDVEQRPTFYSGKCLECHSKRGCSVPENERTQTAPQGSCVHCHMPKLKAEIVPHTTQTDHRIRRRKVREPALRKGQDYTIFQEPGFQLSEVEQARARGLLLIRMVEGQRRGDLMPECEKLLKQALTSVPDDDEVLEALGAVCLAQGRLDDAEEYWRKLLTQSPNHERALMRMGALLHDSGRKDEAQLWLSEALAVNPWSTESLGREAHILGQQGRLDRAIPLALQALELEPRLLTLYQWLSEVYAARGNMQESQRYSRLRERINERLSR